MVMRVSYVRTHNRRGQLFVLVMCFLVTVLLGVRIVYIMINQADYYGDRAKEVQQRERSIKAARGVIYDRNGNVLAGNKTVCTISVIHNQIKEPEKVAKVLAKKLNLDEEKVLEKVNKVSSLERIKSNVEKEIADEIRKADLDGVMIDEDYARSYPYDELASKVIGFTGGDNQGIIGLEVEYEKYLKGQDGKILTYTDIDGLEVDGKAKERIEPVQGYNLVTSLDINIQSYAYQLALEIMEAKNAKNVKLIVMNPQNGEIYACVNAPEFDLNNPFELTEEFLENNIYEEDVADITKLNEMWRNNCISDTYEPGSVFKIVTATAALEEGKVSLNEHFSCPGYRIVEDRRIRCHKVGGHGSETFAQGVMNSCNPVFMDIAARVGREDMYKYYDRLGLFDKTGIDVPGEAGSIMHKLENIKAVELATMSFGQSIQITPFQMLRAASAVVNGGRLVTPHFGVRITDSQGREVLSLSYDEKDNAVSEETCKIMKDILEKVVSEGSGSNAFIEGYRIGGKTATSQKLPRGNGKYISSFLGFADADNPTVMAIVLIDEPEGLYYGGTIAAPIIKKLYENILPYLNIICHE